MDRELPRQQQRDIVDFIKEATPAKAPSRPLDHTRIMDMNANDPRVAPEQWPCYGNHVAMKPHSNAHGEWVHCAVCNLRLRYNTEEGEPKQFNQGGESLHGGKDASRTSTFDARAAVQQRQFAWQCRRRSMPRKSWCTPSTRRRGINAGGQHAYPKAAATSMTSPTSRKSPTTTPPRTPPRSHQSWDMVSSPSEAGEAGSTDSSKETSRARKKVWQEPTKQGRTSKAWGDLLQALDSSVGS